MKPLNPTPMIGFGRKTENYYKGIKIMSDPKLHEQIADIACNRIGLSAGKARILDWGCGEGALSQRLHDLGFDVDSVDKHKESFKAAGPHFQQVDFDNKREVETFVSHNSGNYDLIVSLEVVEHVRNPWDFFENLKLLCGNHTNVLVTTPNISSWWARFMFLITGELWGFDNESWVNPGHINPISSIEMQGILRATGFECLNIFPCGELPVIWLFNYKRTIISLLMLPLYIFMRGQKRGWALCYHAKLRKS